MTVAAAAVTAADRRAIGAMFACIFWKTPDDLGSSWNIQLTAK
jgi:hypothetical protein